MREGIEAVPTLVRQLYAIVRQLEEHFEGRKFTPDGHLVGSIGEVLAAYHYGLDLHTASAVTHDACCPNGREVQIKATQGTRVALRAEPEHMLVLKLAPDGSFEEVYNGPGALAWAHTGRMQKNGQAPISVARLRRLMDDVPVVERLPRLIP